MEEQAEKEKRKVHRSPGYPVFKLEDAIQKVEAVYKAEKRSATTAEVIASHLGYNSATGPGGRAVSALRQFGLLEESNGKLRISDTAYTLIHYDRKSPDWRQAAAQAAVNPTLFGELAEKYLSGLPSDATLKHELLERGFNPSAIPDVVSIFKDTMSLAEVLGNDYTGPEGNPVMPEIQTPAPTQLRTQLPSSAAAAVTSKPRSYAWALSGDFTAKLDLIGEPQTEEDLEALRDYVDITIKALTRSLKKASTKN